MRSKNRQSVFIKDDSALQNLICFILLIRTNLVIACDDHAETFIHSNTPPVPDDTECLRSIAQCLSLSLPPGHYPVCGDCASFYKCDPPRLTAALLQCPSTLLFDPRIGVCNHRYAVNCASDGEPTATTQLPSPVIESGAATIKPAKDASTSLWSEPSVLLSTQSVSRRPLRDLPDASLLTTTPTTSFASFAPSAPVSTVVGRESRPLAKTTDAASLKDDFVSHVQALAAASVATEAPSNFIKQVTVPDVFPQKTSFPSGFLPEVNVFPGQMNRFPLRAESLNETFSPTLNISPAKEATSKENQFSTTEKLSTETTKTEATSVKTVLSIMPSSVEPFAKDTKAELQSSMVPQSKQTIITSTALSNLSSFHSTNLPASTSFLVTSPPSSPAELEVSSVSILTSLPKSASLDTEAALSALAAPLDGSGKNSTTSADSASSVPLAVLPLTDSSPFSKTLQASAAELSSSSVSSLLLSALSSSSSSLTPLSSQAISSPSSTLSSSLPLLSSTSSSSSQKSGVVSRKAEPAEIIDAAIEELPGLVLRRVTCWKSNGPSDQCRAASQACLSA